MIGAIGDILPLAVGVAISPIPVIAVILLLFGPRARTTSAAFLAGWLAGVAVVVAVSTAVSGAIPDHADGPQPILGGIKVILGGLLLAFAGHQWHSLRAGDSGTGMPRWMSAIDSVTSARALLLGMALSALNPKNLVLCVGAGVAISSASLNVGAGVIVAIVFVVLAGSTVLIPVSAYAFASTRLRRPLDRVKDWLVTNNGAVMAILLLVLGVAQIGQGLTEFD